MPQTDPVRIVIQVDDQGTPKIVDFGRKSGEALGGVGSAAKEAEDKARRLRMEMEKGGEGLQFHRREVKHVQEALTVLGFSMQGASGHVARLGTTLAGVAIHGFSPLTLAVAAASLTVGAFISKMEEAHEKAAAASKVFAESFKKQDERFGALDAAELGGGTKGRLAAIEEAIRRRREQIEAFEGSGRPKGERPFKADDILNVGGFLLEKHERSAEAERIKEVREKGIADLRTQIGELEEQLAIETRIAAIEESRTESIRASAAESKGITDRIRAGLKVEEDAAKVRQEAEDRAFLGIKPPDTLSDDMEAVRAMLTERDARAAEELAKAREKDAAAAKKEAEAATALFDALDAEEGKRRALLNLSGMARTDKEWEFKRIEGLRKLGNAATYDQRVAFSDSIDRQKEDQYAAEEAAGMRDAVEAIRKQYADRATALSKPWKDAGERSGEEFVNALDSTLSGAVLSGRLDFQSLGRAVSEAIVRGMISALVEASVGDQVRQSMLSLFGAVGSIFGGGGGAPAGPTGGAGQPGGGPLLPPAEALSARGPAITTIVVEPPPIMAEETWRRQSPEARRANVREAITFPGRPSGRG